MRVVPSNEKGYSVQSSVAQPRRERGGGAARGGSNGVGVDDTRVDDGTTSHDATAACTRCDDGRG